jgi:hypothetical protein
LVVVAQFHDPFNSSASVSFQLDVLRFGRWVFPKNEVIGG